MKLYSSATSDTGPGNTTRAGNRQLSIVLTADTRGGRSEVLVLLESDPYTGEVTLRLVSVEICEGFSIRQ